MIEEEKLLAHPFPGLRSFESTENYLFFGRDGQSDEVLTKLASARFVAVVGTSGSGKSSLVRAGLLPALLSGHMPSAGSSWRIAGFRPGSSPIGNLAKALSEPNVFGTGESESNASLSTQIERTLRRSSLGLLEVISQARMAPYENLLILADQFEELFRFRKKSSDEHPADEAAAFVKLLLETRQSDKTVEQRLPIYVILTMRSDYLGDCAHFWGLPEAINDGQYLIPRMTDDDRREAITGPVMICDAKITGPLVNRLLNDAGDDPAQLPILQHALMRTWDYWKKENRPSEPIDLRHYEQIGGMTRALSLHADEAFLELSPALQIVAERLFKSLTEKEADDRAGRQPATVAEIAAASEVSEEEVKSVIETFRSEGRSFLMPPPTVPLTSDTLIDISHESLIGGWQRLSGWVDAEAQSARQYVRLADTAALFPKEADYLRDPALQVALNWREKQKPTKAWAVRYHLGFEKAIEYLEVSKARREADIDEAERKHREQVEKDLTSARAIAAEQKRRVRQLWFGLALMSVLLLGMLAATAYAAFQRSKALGALFESERQRNIALLSNGEAVKQRQIAEEALKTARADRDKAQNAETETVRQRDLARKERANAESQSRLALSAKNEAEKQKGEAEKQRREAESQKMLAETALSEETHAREEAKRSEEAALKAKREVEKSLATIREIDRSAPYFQAIMRGHESNVVKGRFNNDGSLVITQEYEDNGFEEQYLAWNSMNGERKAMLPSGGALSNASPVSFSDDGTVALLTYESANPPYTVVWDVQANKTLVRLPWSKEDAYYSIMSPNGRIILVNDYDKGLYILDGRKGYQIVALANPPSVGTQQFSPDDKYIVLFSGAAAEVWDTATGKSVAALRGHVGEIRSLAFSKDGTFVVTASTDGTARVWDVQTGKSLQLSGHEGAVNSAVFSDDGRYIVTTSQNRGYLWETKSMGTWTEVSDGSPTILRGHTDQVTNAIFSHDGKWVVTISDDRTAQLWDARTVPGPIVDGRHLPGPLPSSVAVFRGHIKALTSVDFSQNSKYLQTGSKDRTARVWDLTSLGAFSVANVTLAAKPEQYEGKCPVTIKFTGTITVQGRSGTVKYKFVRSDGSESLPQELVFDGPGTKSVSETRDVIGVRVPHTRTLLATEGWDEIVILDPREVTSSRANFTVRCTNVEQIAERDLTSEQLKQIMPNSTEEQRALYLPYLQKAMEEFGIDTPLQRAAFLTEVGYNTLDLKILTELGGDDYFEKRYGTRKDLGNFEPGDGARYRGRGAFFLTGKATYRSFGQVLGVDLVNYPERAAAPDLVFRTAGVYWQKNGLNTWADQSDIVNVDSRIRGTRQPDLAKMQDYFQRAKAVLTAGTSPN